MFVDSNFFDQVSTLDSNFLVGQQVLDDYISHIFSKTLVYEFFQQTILTLLFVYENNGDCELHIAPPPIYFILTYNISLWF